MTEPYYTTLRAPHMGGGEAARGAVPILGLPIILWARKRVGQVTTGSEPQLWTRTLVARR